MYQENYKGFDINELYDEQQKPYYNIAKVLKDATNIFINFQKIKN